MKCLLMLLKPIIRKMGGIGMSLLGKVLMHWKTSGCPPYTWRNITEVIEDVLEEKYVAEGIKTFLNQH